MGKRASVSGSRAASPLAKCPKGNTAYAGVVDALNKAAGIGLDAHSARMLAAGLPGAFSGPVEERHEVQKNVICMLEEIVENVRTKLQEDLDMASSKVTELEGSRGSLQGKLQEANETAAAAAEESSSKSTALAEATERVIAAEETVKQKEEALKEACSALAKGQESKDSFASCIETHFRPLQSGECDPESLEAHKAALLPLLEAAGLEESCLMAFPSCCAKACQERTSFDTMVFQAVDGAVEKRSEELTEAVAKLTSTREKAEAELKTEALPALSDAQASKQQAAEESGAANVHEQEARAAAEVALQSTIDFEPELAKAASEKEERAVELENFIAYNVGSLELLRDPPRAKEPVPLVEAPAATASEVGL